MFEVPLFNVDKFVHKLYQNLGLRIESPVCKNPKKITFIAYVDRACRVRQQLLCTVEKLRDVSMSQNLDFSNERNIQYFIQKHSGLFDKFASLSNTQILTSHLKNINTKIVQKVRMRRKNIETMKKVESKLFNKNIPCSWRTRTNLAHKLDGSKKNVASHTLCKEKRVNSHNYKRSKCRKTIIFQNATSNVNNGTVVNDLLKANNTEKVSGRHNLPIDIISVAKRKIEMAEKFLSFYTRDVEFLKRNVRVTLHIVKKPSYSSDTKDRLKYSQELCRHAILCLIEPSEKAFVLFEDDLSVTIEKYLLQGHKYQFEFQRDSEDYYIALLVLSQWAKVLVQYTNTATMHTICGILGCNVQNILVLYSLEEKLL